MSRDLYLTKLKSAKISNTKPRRLIFEILESSNHSPLTMSELIEKTSHEIDRATVYRCVETLELAGVVKRLHLGWKYKFELSDDFHGHHHHMTCTMCGAVHVTHDDAKLEKVLHEMSEACGYSMHDHQVEIRGLCQNCQ